MVQFRVSLLTETPYGFKWGDIEVERTASVDGRKSITIKTPRQTLEVYVTPAGMLRAGKLMKTKKGDE